MAVCLLMQFAGVEARTYDSVMNELGLRSDKPEWPNGIISHVAGFSNNAMYVVDVWESQQAFDSFLESRLRPAFETVGGLPQPDVITFDVHNTYNVGGDHSP